MLDHEVCRGLDHLREELRRVEALGGEGLMLRKAGSRYEVGRSSSLLKVKSFFDAEARVIEHLAGEQDRPCAGAPHRQVAPGAGPQRLEHAVERQQTPDGCALATGDD